MILEEEDEAGRRGIAGLFLLWLFVSQEFLVPAWICLENSPLTGYKITVLNGDCQLQSNTCKH